MGASSSIIEKKIYKIQNCGCIYSCDEKYNIELPFCCHACLDCIRNLKSNATIITTFDEVKQISNIDLLINDNNWITQDQAIIFAQDNNIQIYEFIKNKDILKNFNFKFL
jgi:hypothetical protein